MNRNAWIGLGVVAVAIIAVVAIVVSQNDDTTTTTTIAGATTTAAPEGPTVRLVTSGGLDEDLVVTSCENPGETTLSLMAESSDLEDPLVLELDAEGGTGSIVLSGSQESEGTVDEVMVGDTGEITARGALTPADDSSVETETYELTGKCA